VAPAAVSAPREVTRSVPIIAMDLESDPVANGWAASLAHPGGNSRCFSWTCLILVPKSLQLLREGSAEFGQDRGALASREPFSLQLDAVQARGGQAAVRSGGCSTVSRVADFEAVFRAMAQSQVGAFDVVFAAFAGNPRLARRSCLQNRLPAISHFPDFARNGGP